MHEDHSVSCGGGSHRLILTWHKAIPHDAHELQQRFRGTACDGESKQDLAPLLARDAYWEVELYFTSLTT